MGRPINYHARALLTDASAFERKLDVPVLIWKGAHEPGPAAPQPTTSSGHDELRPQGGETLVFELRKRANKNNPFSMGVTIGRVEANDIQIDDTSVSRFHAYFLSTGDGWQVVDADSKNGSWLDGLKLEGSKKTRLNPTARLRFGDVEMTFMAPAVFLKHLRESMAS